MKRVDNIQPHSATGSKSLQLGAVLIEAILKSPQLLHPKWDCDCIPRGVVVHAVHIPHHMTLVLGHGQGDSAVEQL